MDSDNEHRSIRQRLLHDAEATAWLQRHLGGRPIAVELVQSLWSGYGELIRVRMADAQVASAIVKWVEPPEVMRHPRGFAGSASQERKLRSYAVERCFYTQWCPSPVASHRTARCHAAEAGAGGFRFLLEDLDAAGFALRRENLDSEQLEDCLRWLAGFHAHYLEREPMGLWPVGTYWHLATRREEFERMRDAPLREAAEQLDAALSN